MESIKTKNPKFTITFAKPEDAHLIVDYMKKLGEYQKMIDKITIEEDEISKILAENRGEAIFGNYNGEIVGFAYFYNNSSAFIGQRGIYIDAFYVDETMRFKGLGKIMIAFIAQTAISRGCKRLELGCLDWNEPSIKLYKEMGAVSIDNMTIHRFMPEKLKEIADQF